MKQVVTFKDIELEVEFDYQPLEKEVRYYNDGSGYPGCPESIEINAVFHSGEDITNLFLEVMFKELEELVWQTFLPGMW